MNLNEDLSFYSTFITNPDKLFYPDDGLTKQDIISYYLLMADYILPYVKNRPFVMSRYPDGINNKKFYQKEMPAYAPNWMPRFHIYHEDGDKIVHYPVITDTKSLLWLVNQGAIELHCWLSKIEHIEYPDIMIIDLDPEPPATFKDVLTVASLIRNALIKLGIDAWPKTSGASGLHLFVPITPKYTFRETTLAAKNLFEVILQVYPEKVTLEHIIAKRKGKVYLDYLQNSRGRTMAFPYSLRPVKNAPVSTPLFWEEVEERKIEPSHFTIKNIWSRIKKYGDIMQNLLHLQYELTPLLNLKKH